MTRRPLLCPKISTLLVANSAEETYRKFKEYLSYLRGELSNEMHFLNEVDAEALHYGMKDLALLGTDGPENKQDARTNESAPKENKGLPKICHQTWKNEQSTMDHSLRETFAALVPIRHSSDESSSKGKEPTHIVPSLQTMLSRREIMIMSSTQPEQATVYSAKSGKPSSGEKKDARKSSMDLSVQGKGYPAQTLLEPSVLNIPKKSATSDRPPSPSSSSQKVDNEVDSINVEKQADGIFKGAFLPKRKSVHHVLYETKKDELAKYLQTRHGYNKESSEKIANHLFKTGITGVSHNRLSRLLTKLLREKTASKGTVGSDEISDSIHRNLVQRLDKLIDWVELLDSVPDISAGLESTTSPSSQVSTKSYASVWSVSASAERKTKTTLPLLKPEIKPSVESIKSKASALMTMAKKASTTPTSLSSSDLTTSEISKRSSPLVDVVAKTDSSESVQREIRLLTVPSPRLGETPLSKTTTSPYGTWAYTASTETPSSEFTNRVLTEENADLEPRRPIEAVLRDSAAIVSPFEVAEHIANVLEAIMDVGEESNALIRGTLNAFAESPPHLDYLDKLVNKYHQEMSIFWNDNDKGVKLMNVFKDLIFDTASMMLRHLDTEKTARLLRQTKKTASAMFLKLSQIGTIEVKFRVSGRLNALAPPKNSEGQNLL